MVKIVFFGTPDIAVPFLKELVRTHDIVAVVTQPDRPARRGQSLQPSPVKEAALEHNIPVLQPERLAGDFAAKVRALDARVGVVVAYGNLIPEEVYSAPAFGCFNVHFSLLPRYRGAAPVQWALINGEKETGVSTFWIEKTLDSGPILVRKSLPIADDDDAASLMRKLVPLGVEAMKETLGRIQAGDSAGTPQHGEVSYAPSLKKEDGRIVWSKSAGEIVNLVRGTQPWPGTYAVIKEGKGKGKRLKILKASATHSYSSPVSYRSGQVVDVVRYVGFVVQSGHGGVLVREVQPENKIPMSAWAFLQGGFLQLGDLLE